MCFFTLYMHIYMRIRTYPSPLAWLLAAATNAYFNPDPLWDVKHATAGDAI